MIDLRDVRMKYSLSVGLAELLCRFLDEKIITDVTRATIQRLRVRLTPHGYEVRSGRDLGYWLDAETKRRIMVDLGLASDVPGPALDTQHFELPGGQPDNSADGPTTPPASVTLPT